MVERHPKWRLLDVVLAAATVAVAITITQVEQRPHDWREMNFWGVRDRGRCLRCGVDPKDHDALPRPCLELSARVGQESD